MKELMPLNTKLENKEELYLLIGEIPIERMYIVEGKNSKIDGLNTEDSLKDIQSRLYFKSENNDGKFTMNSVDENPCQDHYYFGYSDSEIEKFRKSFIGLREFLASARYVGRQFEPTANYYIDTLYGDDTISLSVLDEVENIHEPRLLICILRNKALVKKNSNVISGFDIIDSKETPLGEEKYYRFVGEKEDILYTHNDIVKGIISDIRQTMMANFPISTSYGTKK